MDVERAVDDFVKNGISLFRQLQSEGTCLSYLALQTLRTQLHVLRVEADRLEHLKRIRVKSRGRHNAPDVCEHHRLIDDCLDATGGRAVYCVECGEILKDTFPKSE